MPASPPPWMTAKYEFWTRDAKALALNMLENPDFAGEFDVAPYREYNGDLRRQYTNLMSGDVAWKHAVSFYIILLYSKITYLSNGRISSLRKTRTITVQCLYN